MPETDIVLINPPVSDPTQSYSAIPSLCGYLRYKGIKVSGLDANIDSLSYFLNSRYIQEKLDLFFQSQTTGTNHKDLSKMELASILYSRVSEHITDAVNSLKNVEIFRDGDAYNTSMNIIDNAFFIINTTLKNEKLGLFSYTCPKPSIFLENPRQSIYYDFWEQWICKKLPDRNKLFVGISITYSDQLIPSLVLTSLIKQKHPDYIIIAGGQYISEICRSELKSSLISGFFDHVITNEGERALYDLITGNEEKDFLIDGSKKTIEHDYSPDYSDFVNYDYLNPYKTILYPLSRGCYWRKCRFCDISSATTGYLAKNIDTVIKEIIDIKKSTGSDYFIFSGDAINIKYLKQFSLMLIELGIKIEWITQMRMEDQFLDQELCHILYESGCRYIFFGMETASQQLTKKMNKGTNPENYSQILSNLNRAGIKCYVAWIVGFPGAKKADFKDTFDFIQNNKENIYSAGVSYFYLAKGSDVYKHPEKYGISLLPHHEDLGKESIEFQFIQDDKNQENYEEYLAAQKLIKSSFSNLTTGTTNSHLFSFVLNHQDKQRINKNNSKIIISGFKEHIQFINSLFFDDRIYLFNEKNYSLYYLSHDEYLEFQNMFNCEIEIDKYDFVEKMHDMQMLK